VGLECRDFFVCVVIEDAELEIVGACDEPVLARNKFAAPNRNLGNLERLDNGACIMVIYVYGAVVEAGQEPWLGGVKVDAFDSLGPVEQLPLDGVSKRGELGNVWARTLTSNNILAKDVEGLKMQHGQSPSHSHRLLLKSLFDLLKVH
jgi:hypothetical protein